MSITSIVRQRAPFGSGFTDRKYVPTLRLRKWMKKEPSKRDIHRASVIPNRRPDTRNLGVAL